MKTFSIIIATALFACLLGACSEAEARRSPAVVVNGQTLSAARLRRLARKANVRPAPGRYWYDRKSGLWGYEGYGASGIMRAGLRIGGKLRRDASNGNTGVIVNGRELNRTDVLALQTLTPVYRGRYWMDARGNVGPVGGRATLNLYRLAASRGYGNAGAASRGATGGGYGTSSSANSGGTTFWRSKWTGIGAGSSDGATYVIGSDFSYISE